MVDEHFESMTLRVTDALSMHARSEIGTDELIQRLEHVHQAIDNAHADAIDAIWLAVNGLIDHQYDYDEAERVAALSDVRARLAESLFAPE